MTTGLGAPPPRTPPRGRESRPRGRFRSRSAAPSAARSLALGLLLLGLAGDLPAQDDVYRLDAAAAEQSGVLLARPWSFLPGEGEATRPPPPEDPRWTSLSTRLGDARSLAAFPGTGWFRVHLEVADELVGVPLGLRFHRHAGASRVFLDGRRIAEIGSPSTDPETIVPRLPADPVLFVVDEPGRHDLFVQFFNPQAAHFRRVGTWPGFSVRVGRADQVTAGNRLSERILAGRRGLFTGIFLCFAVLHVLLFVFRPKSLENLYFAGLCVCLATLAFLLVHKPLHADPRIVFWSEAAMGLAGVGVAVFGVLFVHRAFSGRRPRWLPWALGVLALATPWLVLRPGDSVLAVFGTMALGLLEMARTVVLAALRRVSGAGIVGVGILALALGFGVGLLSNLGILPRTGALSFLAPFLSVLVLILSMSVYLSRRYAHTQRDLEHQLEEVRRLSEERLAQERREREHLIRTELLEAEVKRRTEELEEARRLQLSMLPQGIPEHPDVVLAAHMTTATEVGGDYYDFDVAEDGTLTLAIGDATGHGMRAGTMVTATKSLFNALGGDRDLIGTVERSNLALKRMNLRTLAMALLLARYRDGSLRIAAAGMPPPFVYRAASKSVETIDVAGMPLGSVKRFPYRAVDVELAPGDVVLFMSDGFPERGDPAGEQLGYERALARFESLADLSLDAMLDRLAEAGEEWAQGGELEDDVTFVALAVRGVTNDARGAPLGA